MSSETIAAMRPRRADLAPPGASPPRAEKRLIVYRSLPTLSRSPIDDVRIRAITELAPPSRVIGEFSTPTAVADLVYDSRDAVHRILHREDDRLVVIVGPCSVHDTDAALDYARRLVAERVRLAEHLEIVMRVYFEKPRTTVGWKGLINDPGMDESFDINRGLRTARKLMLDIGALGLPAGCEFLDTITPQYVADLAAWGAIGARTTESQVHRELASGLSCPVGFKNGTDGNIKIAIDAILAASRPHHFLSVTKEGRSAIVETSGNDDCHVILRGGKTTNYDAASVAAVCTELAAAGLETRVMIDASHGNSRKQHANQLGVIADVSTQVSGGDDRIVGAMIESNLVAGRQDRTPGRELAYGQSITDACIAWDDTVPLLDALANAVAERRARRHAV